MRKIDKKENVKNKSAAIDTTALYRLLSRAYLSGTLNECPLEIKNNIASIKAVDMSNSVFFSLEEKIDGMDNMDVGLCKLPLLVSFLENNTGADLSYTLEEKWMTLKKKGQGQIKVLLNTKEETPTATPDGDKTAKKLHGMATDTFEITSTIASQICQYIGLIGCGSVVFEVKKGKVHIHNDKKQEQQFNLNCGKLIKEAKADYTVELYSQHLVAALKTIVFGDDKALPTISLGADVPVIIELDKKNFWALTPILAD